MNIPFWPDITEKIKQARERAREAGKYLMVIEPMPPFNQKGLTTALITAASLISIVMLAGVSLVSLAILLTAMALILLILTRILGIDLDLNPEDIFRY